MPTVLIIDEDGWARGEIERALLADPRLAPVGLAIEIDAGLKQVSRKRVEQRHVGRHQFVLRQRHAPRQARQHPRELLRALQSCIELTAGQQNALLLAFEGLDACRERRELGSVRQLLGPKLHHLIARRRRIYSQRVD